MTPEEIVDAAKRLWAQATSSQISDENAWNLTRDAVRFVEAVDYPTGITTADGTAPEFTFVGTPTALSEQLYIYKAVDLFESSDEGKRLLDGSMGVTFKRGPDSIATEGQGRAKFSLLEQWRKHYRRMVFKAVARQNAASTGNVADNYITTDSNLTTTN